MYFYSLMKLIRSTKQKRVINKICQKSGVALTPKEIYSEAKKEIDSINLATIYRNLNQLVEDKKLTKIKHALFVRAAIRLLRNQDVVFQPVLKN